MSDAQRKKMRDQVMASVPHIDGGVKQDAYRRTSSVLCIRAVYFNLHKSHLLIRGL